MRELKLFGPYGNLGYGGVSEEAWKLTREWKLDGLFQQGTSTDGGALYLGTGMPFADRTAIKHNLTKLINEALDLKIPLVCSLGGGGGDEGLEFNLDIIDEIARENNLKFRAAVISGQIDKEFIKKRLKEGRKARVLDPHPSLQEYLTPQMVDESKVIAGQMGPEPIMKAMDMDVDMVLTGRANDTSLPMAIALKNGYPKGISLQMAKVVECSGWAILRDDHVLFPCVDKRKGSKYGDLLSIISHGVFYERKDPTKPEYMPGGHLDITNAKWEQVDEYTTKASGGVWVNDPYTVKLEGAKMIGYRSIIVAGMRDPWLISKVEDGSFLKMSEETAREKISDVGISADDYKIYYKVYGMNGVMGDLEPQKHITSHELCILVDVIGKTPEVSKLVNMYAWLSLMHLPYPGRLTTAGNIAHAISPEKIYVGEAYSFNIWHLLPLEGDEKHEIFKTRITEFPRK